MYKYLLLLVLGISSTCYGYDTRAIFNKLRAVSGLNNTTLKYEKCARDVGAYAWNNQVVVCYNTLKDARNSDEMARILGHELGHLALHHKRSTISNEYAADAMAKIYMLKANYNVCRGVLLLKRRDLPEFDHHPSDYSRYLRFNCGK